MTVLKYALPMALLMATGVGVAQAGTSAETEGAAGSKDKFSQMDSDGDGVITKEEAQGTELEQSFDQLDADADGQLRKDEIGMGGPETEGVAGDKDKYDSDEMNSDEMNSDEMNSDEMNSDEM